MFHFQYNGNFLEVNNRIQQVPNTGVSIFRKSALFSQGGQILIWAMNNLDMDSDFAFCFEFMTGAISGEVALLSNDYQNIPFTYKITYIPGTSMIKAYILLKDGSVAELSVVGVVRRQMGNLYCIVDFIRGNLIYLYSRVASITLN